MRHLSTRASEANEERWRDLLRGRLRGLGVADQDLDDATQDVFEVMVRRIADYDPGRPMQHWLAGIARRVAHRYRERRGSVIEFAEARAGGESSPEEHAALTQARATLRRFLDSLDAERWEVFVLSEIEGLRGSEIAAQLGLNQNTVYARLRSARSAFDRAIARQQTRRNREERWLAAFFVPRSRAPAVVGIGLATVMLCVALATATVGPACRPDSETTERAHATDSANTVADAAPVAKSIGTREVDAPSGAIERPGHETAAPTPDGDGWYEGGSGMMSSRAGTISSEVRYRLSGDELELRYTYIGDDEVNTSATYHLDLDGFEIVAGEAEETVKIPAGEVREIGLRLRAIEHGTVRVTWKDGASSKARTSSAQTWRFVFDGGALRRCEPDECRDPVATGEALSGERITVHVENRCDVPKRFAVYAKSADESVPDDAPQHTLDAGERRAMEIDAAQWFLDVDEHGKPTESGVQIDEDGARVRFSGEDCSDASATSPDFEAPPQ